MRYRELGRHGLRVSEVGLDTRQMGGTLWIGGPGMPRPYGFGQVDESESLGVVSRARAMGINFLLTSPASGGGRAERLIGKAIAGNRDYWVLGVMGGLTVDGTELKRDFSYDALSASLRASLDRLGTSDTDLFMIESVTGEELRDGACIESLRRVARSGLTGFVGVDVDIASADMELLLNLDVDVVRVRYNIFEPLAGEFFAQARNAGLGIIAKGPLADGFLRGNFSNLDTFAPDDERSLLAPERVEDLIAKSESLSFLEMPRRSLAQSALLYVLANRAVSVALTGAASVAEVEEDAAAGSIPWLDDAALDRIRRLQRANFRIA
ncbi:MAG: aldo/keto reductase [Chloroflexi bacterium]|nr:aldo/keto reductase [Chloroflexota bacterium]MCY3938786.1 aldo/keto reductase [Chloroflexota bacterium]